MGRRRWWTTKPTWTVYGSVESRREPRSAWASDLSRRLTAPAVRAGVSARCHSVRILVGSATAHDPAEGGLSYVRVGHQDEACSLGHGDAHGRIGSWLYRLALRWSSSRGVTPAGCRPRHHHRSLPLPAAAGPKRRARRRPHQWLGPAAARARRRTLGRPVPPTAWLGSWWRRLIRFAPGR